MKRLDPELRSLLQELHAADVAPPEAQERVWQSLTPRLGEPLPPTAAAAQSALAGSAGLGGAASTALGKLLIGALLLGAPALGLVYYGAGPRDSRAPSAAPVEAPATQLTSPAVREAPPTVREEASSEPSSLLEETRLLGEAQQALRRGTPRATLRWLDEHAARFPQGTLTQQREAARVFALCDLGRATQARDVQARFLRRWPSSPLSERVKNACPRP